MNYALITGASGGIGAAMARRLAEEGLNVLLVARSEDKLRELKAEIREEFRVGVEYLPLDLLEEGAVDTLLDWCHANEYFVRILINNAGVGEWGPFEEKDLQSQLSMMHLNQDVMVSLTHAFLEKMHTFSSAHILNVGSTASYQPIPFFAVYAATKAFVLSFTRALRHELRRSPINVSCLCPGPTDSDFFSRAGFISKQANSIMMAPEAVADIAIKGLFKSKAVIVPGFSNGLGVVMSKILPQGMLSGIVGSIFKPRSERMIED
ncbi:SDR family NAD(P)-dependent oxidoreductase [Roseivirga sp. BDSF3-8]|uniref:SDR family NAD(P)-dependent oxidoreductase n=1 Tax=Roseivirga sp. BDSF3-8 TaxID=3241598 RepID=UPI0035325709